MRAIFSGTAVLLLVAGALQAQPSATLSAVHSRDSEGNAILSTRVRLDLPAVDGLRLGATGSWLRSEDPDLSASAWEGSLFARWQPARSTRLDGEVGFVRIEPGELSSAGKGTATARVRGRWRGPSGAAADVRLRREPVSATPLLFGTPIVVSEVRGVADIPLAGPLLGRGVGRIAHLQAPGDTNTRTGLGAGPVIRLGGLTDFGVLYHTTRFAAPTEAPYFAPERVQALEVTLYAESYRAWPIVLAIDLGAGAERIADWARPAGDWSPAFRAWSQLSWEMESGRELRVELEAYDTRAGAALAPLGEAWRWGSVELSFRTPLGRR